MENQMKCENCQLIFSLQKIDLHQAYCRRNIRKCKQCIMMIDINNQQAHDNEYHNKKSCQLCQSLIPSSQLDHKLICPRRAKQCKFCHNDFPFNEILKHEDICGSRTTPCPICKRYIKLRDEEEHISHCIDRRQMHRNESQENWRRSNRERMNSNEVREIKKERQGISPRIPIGPRNHNNVREQQIIGPEPIRRIIDPLPISVKLAYQKRDKQKFTKKM